MESHTVLMDGKVQCNNNAMHACLVQFFVTLWTVARQAPLSMGILQARILEWVAISSSRDLLSPGIKTTSHLMSSALAGRFFNTGTIWQAQWRCQFSPNWHIGLTKSLSKSHERFAFNINRIIALILWKGKAIIVVKCILNDDFLWFQFLSFLRISFIDFLKNFLFSSFSRVCNIIYN